MSLTMYYRDCLTADISSTNNTEKLSIFETIQKTYVSDDRYFAGVSVGHILIPEEWEKARKILSVYSLYKTDDNKEAEKNASAAFDQIYKKTRSTSSSIIMVMGNLFVHIEHEIDHGCRLTYLRRDIPYTAGTAKSAANVIIDSNKIDNFERFYQIISMSVSDVTSEFTKIDLSTIIDTPWYNSKQPIKKISVKKRVRK